MAGIEGADVPPQGDKHLLNDVFGAIRSLRILWASPPARRTAILQRLDWAGVARDVKRDNVAIVLRKSRSHRR